jgi:hypothetical protein
MRKFLVVPVGNDADVIAVKDSNTYLIVSLSVSVIPQNDLGYRIG